MIFHLKLNKILNYRSNIFAGLFLYTLSFVVWVFALSKVQVSIAYPMLSIGYIVNAMLAYYFFSEALTKHKVSGLFIILIGVIVLARG